jgi:putative cell wall-binding protein
MVLVSFQIRLAVVETGVGTLPARGVQDRPSWVPKSWRSPDGLALVASQGHGGQVQKPRWSRPGRIAAAAVATTLAVLSLGTTAHAVADVTTSRLAGADRYATAAAVATAAYPSGADTVVVASGLTYPDALAGAALAGRLGAPVLLTSPTALSPATSSAIDTLKATKAVILGGTTAVSQSVQDALAKEVTVSRIAGTDRYDTAAQIATAIGAANIGSTSGRRSALIATGSGFADALAGGALAAAGSSGVLPVLLVADDVPDSTESALRDLGITQTVILGGTAAVSTVVAVQLQTITGNAPARLAGTDRYATATAIAGAEISDHGFGATQPVLANGLNFADALAGGPFAGKAKAPILLTAPGTLSTPTADFLRDNTATVTGITALGGTSAVADATLQAAKSAAQGDAESRANEDLTVTPQEAGQQPNTSSGTRTYTASGMGASAVDIALVPCDQVTTSSSGNTRLANDNANTIADSTARTGSAPDLASSIATIASVNGAPAVGANNDYADDASPSGGKVTFVVNGTTGNSGCVVPVVFVDANSDDALNGSTTDPSSPSEAFGSGGATDFAPPTASNGSFEDVTANTVREGRFVGCPDVGSCNTYFYDSGDTFQIAGAGTTMATFADALSAGDRVSGTYTADGVSTFDLSDVAPAAPGAVTAMAAADSSDVTVAFGDSSTSSVDSYDVLRAPGTAGTLGSVSCPATTSDEYDEVGSVDDTGTPLGYTFTDDDTEASTRYCYAVRAVDDNDTGPPNSTASGVTTNG